MCGFIIYGLILLWYVPSILIYYRDFLSLIDVESCQRFSCIFLDENIIFVLYLVNMLYHIDLFVDIEPSLHL